MESHSCQPPRVLTVILTMPCHQTLRQCRQEGYDRLRYSPEQEERPHDRHMMFAQEDEPRAWLQLQPAAHGGTVETGSKQTAGMVLLLLSCYHSSSEECHMPPLRL